jgi:IS30 family transposase
MNTHKYTQLSLEQRSQLQLLLKIGKSKKEIAKELGVHRSTVYRDMQVFLSNFVKPNQNVALVT